MKRVVEKTSNLAGAPNTRPAVAAPGRPPSPAVAQARAASGGARKAVLKTNGSLTNYTRAQIRRLVRMEVFCGECYSGMGNN